MSRFARCERDTKETEIVIELDLDGTGQYDIHTGIGFFDHMLEVCLIWQYRYREIPMWTPIIR